MFTTKGAFCHPGRGLTLNLQLLVCGGDTTLSKHLPPEHQISRPSPNGVTFALLPENT